jgi:protein O-mannosyl-transferase
MDWLFIIALLAAVILVYQPAWHGRFIWDDDMHVTRPELRSWHGLYRIWFDVGATLQYYPLLHSAFWVEHKLWGDAAFGYHLVNIFLHATAALMVAAVLRRLKIPGAYLAAAIFALHPIQTESVAWITEQKNTLSAVFYLGSLLAYLRFDQTRKTSSYCWALGLFVLGMMSKTVIATLPGAVLVIFWWQRGRLSWRSDVLPLVPFFLLGAGGGMITAWWELQINKCAGPDFTLTFAERFLIAGRTVWFLLWKLFWPTQLTFIYPRWQIDTGIWWQYLFPLGAAVLLAALWSMRRRARAPLAAVLFFGGTLFPVLGFFNLYTFLYSFVANHYQYLAGLGIITLVASGAALLLDRWGLWGRPGGYALCLVPLAILAGLTWQQSRMYSDLETLYRTTIAENPGCWMAHDNLGVVLARRGQADEAMVHYRKSMELKPDYIAAYNNLGMALTDRGQFDEAIVYYRKALEIKPGDSESHNNLGLALAGRGRLDDAMAEYGKALDINPNYGEAHNNLGLALRSRGQLDEAMAEYRKALEINPDNTAAHNNLAAALAASGQLDDAIVHYRKALQLSPQSVEFHYNLAHALANRGEFDEMMAEYGKALEIKPDYAEAHNNLGVALVGRGRLEEAIVHFQTALKIKPDYAEARNNLGVVQSRREEISKGLAARRESLRSRPNDLALLNETAWMLATDPNASIRNGAEAVELAERAARLSDGREAAIIGTLAAAYAEAGRFSEAVKTAEQALALAASQNNAALADALRTRIKLYQSHSPYHELQQQSPPQSGQP